MFLPLVIPSIFKTLFIYFSKVEAVSASVRDSKTTLATKQAKFLNKQFSYNRLSFQVFWMQKLIEFGISFPRWVGATRVE